MSGSTIGQARQNLYANLRAAADQGSGMAIGGVQVTFGPPDQYEEQEVVCLTGVTGPAEAPVILGSQSVRHEDETYRLTVEIKAYDPQASSDPNAAVSVADLDARGWAMAAAVRDVVIGDRTIGGVLLFAHVAAQESDGPQIPVDLNGQRVPGYVIRVVIVIACFART